MITIALNPSEKKRVLLYSEEYLSGQSHWGDGEVEIPEEANIYEQCQGADGSFHLTFFQFKIIFQWFLTTTQHGTYMLDEDMKILRKMAVALSLHCKEKDIPFFYNPGDNGSEIKFIQSVIHPDPAPAIEKPLREPDGLDDRIRKAADNKRENEESKSGLIERIKKQNEENIKAENFLKKMIKKTKGKNLF